MPSLTTNYSLQLPLVNDPTDEDLWGGELNDDMTSIDTLMRSGITIATQASQTAGFTAAATISIKRLYPCDATGGAFSGTLPAASASANGATVFIKKTDASANAITIARTGADTLDGATSLSLPSQNDCYGLVSDGVSKWSSICKPAVVPTPSVTVIRTQTFTSTGTYTPHASMLYCIAELAAGGGGGFGSPSTGTGGGAGGYSRKSISKADIGASKAVTIGAGGGANSAGGSTSLGAIMSATGGSAGGGSTGGTGGTGTGGDVNLTGGTGSGDDSIRSHGGSSYFGGEGAGTAAAAANTGSGGGLNASGGSGIVIVTEYCSA